MLLNMTTSMWYFISLNYTSCKQPCDIKIIVILKIRYKYLNLKYILDFYKLEEELKKRKRELEKYNDKMQQ